MEPVCAGLSSQMPPDPVFRSSRGDSECSGIAPLEFSAVSKILVRLLMSESYARRKPRAVRGLDDHTDLGELSHLVPCFQCDVGRWL